MTVAARLCLKCGGELVKTFRPNENASLSARAEGQMKTRTNWRCSTCGSIFTAEELRAERQTNLASAQSRK